MDCTTGAAMKLITADFHLSINSRDSYRLKFLQRRLPNLVRKWNVDSVYILGDITERKDNHNAELVNNIVDGLAELGRICEVTVLRGNHDYTDIDNPFFHFLSHIHGVGFINTPETIGNELWLPHTRDHTDWDRLNFVGIKRIFTHNTFSGAVGDNGQPLDGIPLDALPKHIPIISGDVHVPQKLGNVTYVGAPYTIDFGDDFQPRVLLLGDKITSLKLNGPQKRLYRVESVEQLREQLNGRFTDGDVIRVEVTLQPGDYAGWAALKQRIIELFEHEDVWLDGVIPVIAGGVTPAARQHRAPASDEAVLKTYCTQRGVDDDTMQAGLQLL